MRKLRPYLDADRGYPIGYKSCTWNEDDATSIKVILVAACIIAVLLLSYVLGII